MRKNQLLIGFLATLLLLMLSVGFSPEVIAASTNTIAGDRKTIGNGSVRTWLKVDQATGVPVSIGVTLTEDALGGLPADDEPAQKGSLKLKLIDGSPYHNFEYELMFPEQAEEKAFSHMGFNWNPEGHKPLPDVFFRPHFDVHFYMATPEYRHSIKNEDLLDLDILNLVVDHSDFDR